MLCKFFDKKAGSGAKANVNEVLPQELHKPLINKFKRIKRYASYKDNIWAADLAEMGSLSSKNRGVMCHKCFHQYAWAKPIKDKDSCPEVSCKKVVLINFEKLTGKRLCQSLFFNKVAGLRPFCEIFKNFFFHRTTLVAAS